jgi:hypothetical protein
VHTSSIRQRGKVLVQCGENEGALDEH